MTASDVHLTLLGPPAVRARGALQALPLERRTQLAVLLALRRQWVPRTEVAAMLWPEQPTKLAFANLRKTLFRMTALPWAAAIESQPTALRLQVATDVMAFESALHERRLADAVAVYGGELLARFDDGAGEAWSRWVAFERGRLSAAWRSAALELLAAAGLAPAAAIALAVRLLEADPFDEAALQHQLLALAQDGQAAAARQLWQQFAERLAQDLGLEPGAHLRALRERLGAAERLHNTPEPPLPATPADDGFVGRTVELHRMAELLTHADCRLLCLVGPGGVGKTTLARRALALQAGRFAQGVVFAALEGIDTAPLFGQRLAELAGVQSTRGSDPLADVVAAWRDGERLLVLDNFEQLAEHTPLLQRLLQGCPRLKLLVTSRLRLAVAGQWSMTVDGLPCPDPEDEDHAEAFDAVRLFVKAARRVEPAFAASASAAAERSAIVDICRHVDGLPLALELAGAWVRVLSCSAIARELARDTALLRTSDTRHPPRHASIEAVFDHSWQRLGATERTALSRLAVFRSGFSVEAARAVAGAALPVLAALADKSLLRRGEPKLTLHPLVQQFALAKLAEFEPQGTGQSSGTVAAHSHYFLRRLADARAGVRHGDRELLRGVDADFSDLRAAWRHASRHGPAEDLQRAARSLMNYCNHRGRREEGLALLEEALSGALSSASSGESAAAPAAAAAELAACAANMAYRLHRFERAQALATQAYGGAWRTRELATQQLAANLLGSLLWHAGKLPQCKRWFKRALALARKGHDPIAVAGGLDNLALLSSTLGELDEALDLYRQAWLQHRAGANFAGEALSLSNQSALLVARGEVDAARTALLDAQALCVRHGLHSTNCFVESNLATVALLRGDHLAGAHHAQSAIALSESTGERAVMIDARAALGWAALQAGELERARSELAAALTLGVLIGRMSQVLSALVLFGEVLAAQGAGAAAVRVLKLVLQQPALEQADRWRVQQQLVVLGAAAGGPPWRGPSLEQLPRRVIAEAGQAYALLIDDLRRA